MQLVLPVNSFHKQSFENFINGYNVHIVSHLHQILDANVQPALASQSICVLSGLEGLGKTHLCMATQSKGLLKGYKSQYLNMQSLVNMPTEMAEGIADNQVLCLDNIHSLRHNDDWQRVLFDLINQFLEKNGRLLLMSMREPLAGSNWGLKDLKTRLQWGTNFGLAQLSDEEKVVALESYASNIGFTPQKKAMTYLITRVSRNMNTLTEHLRVLDRQSLQQKRKITIPFIKEVLKI
ncbi:DnaA regulatory inactivator Hda [Glaciecola petra]|uniref:DnaA regulatory inactivator Hda n=1 Tax=Glaciecola petra TaxID=3075602 RepID=A0ABU2ZNV0_9ALTE|nr:DnaA regulatory inactivator Hda [Aestuariibacter sp. P117]MDT0594303.1 DnaA regulatory inactivator Hda [Aestuariibacter sp. P117]